MNNYFSFFCVVRETLCVVYKTCIKNQFNNWIRLAILFVGCFLFSENVQAAIYYVDNVVTDTHAASATPDFTTYNHTTFETTGGSDSVFKTIADINAFSTLQPGDMVLFRKSQAWREQLNIPTSGAENNLITFGAYGSGSLPIINGSNIMTGWVVESGSVYKKTGIGASVAFVAIDGALGNYQSSLSGVDSENDWYYDSGGQILYIYSSTDPTGKTIEAGQRSAAIYLNGKSHIAIGNLYFKDYNSQGIWGDEPLTDVTIDSCVFGLGGNFGTGYRKVYFEGYNDESNRQMDHITVSNCSLDDSMGKFFFYYLENLTVNNNNFSSADIQSNRSDTVAIRDNSALFISVQGTNNATISGNTIVGTQYVGPADDCGVNIEDSSVNADVNNIVVEDNDISECDYAGIWAAIDQTGYKLNGLVVRRNHISQSGATKANSGGIMIWYDAANVQIYDNVFAQNGIVDGNYAGGVVLYPHASHYINETHIYNNTFYDNNGAQIRLLSELASDSIADLTVKNNVLYSTDDECIDADSGAASYASNSYDYNLYYRASGNIIEWGSNAYTLAQFANFQSVESEEAHGLAINPLFTSSTDYHLQSTSPAIDVGDNSVWAGVANVTDYEGNLITDSFGTIVASGGVVDMGSYDYQEVDEPPANSNDAKDDPRLDVHSVKIATTENTITITWKTTNSATESVRYGTKLSSLTKKESEKGKSKRHKLTLKNLKPGTIYYFKITAKDKYDQVDRSRIHQAKTKLINPIRPSLIVPRKTVSKESVISDENKAANNPATNNPSPSVSADTNRNISNNSSQDRPQTQTPSQPQPQKSKFIWWKPWTWF